MNSKQRRNKRVFEHEVTLVCRNERYFQFEQRVSAAKQWLQCNTKRKNYILGRQGYDSQVFKFRSAGIASVFALRFI